MTRKNILVALDGEMTSPRLRDGGELIQIGLLDVPDFLHPDKIPYSRFSSFIAPSSEVLWEDSAEAIHGITQDFLKTAPSAEEVDELLFTWLCDTFDVSPRYRALIPVGKNVGAFDMPFIEASLPKTFSLFTRRALDLNSAYFVMEGLEYQGKPLSSAEWKTLSSEYGRRTWAVANGSSDSSADHDAEFDAWVHAYSCVFLQRSLRGLETEMPKISLPDSGLALKIKALLRNSNIDKLSEDTGVPKDFIKGWSIGGRPTRAAWVEQLEAQYAALFLGNT